MLLITTRSFLLLVSFVLVALGAVAVPGLFARTSGRALGESPYTPRKGKRHDEEQHEGQRGVGGPKRLTSPPSPVEMPAAKGHY